MGLSELSYTMTDFYNSDVNITKLQNTPYILMKLGLTQQKATDMNISFDKLV